MLHCLSPRVNVRNLWVYPSVRIAAFAKYGSSTVLLFIALCSPLLSGKALAQDQSSEHTFRNTRDLPARYYIDIYAPLHTSSQRMETMQIKWRNYDFHSLNLQQNTAIPLHDNSVVVVFTKKTDKHRFRQLNRDQKKSYVETLPRASLP